MPKDAEPLPFALLFVALIVAALFCSFRLFSLVSSKTLCDAQRVRVESLTNMFLVFCCIWAAVGICVAFLVNS